MSDLFERARDAMKLEDLAGKVVKLKGRGNELRGQCPLCEASPSSGSVFKVDVGMQRWRCFGCGQFGDVVDLHAALQRMTTAEAARDLAGPAPREAEPKRAVEKPLADDDRAKRIAVIAGDIWRASTPIAGTPGEAYLIKRGIAPEIVDRLDGPRYIAAAQHSWNPSARVWIRSPAIVCRVVTPGGWPGGVHVTYITPDGGKTLLKPRKLMWGPQGEETALGKRRGGAWLIGSFPDDGDLVVGEGIESTLGLASFLWRAGRRDFGVAAALSLGALQGSPRRDGDGCVDLNRPEPDPASPAFTWPPCHTAGERPPLASIAIDRDMSTQKMRGRSGRGRPVDFELDAEARAWLCAILASAAWRAAGWRARAMFPAPNGDWADMVAR